MSLRIIEPVGTGSVLYFSLREAASRVLHSKKRRAVRRRASALRTSADAVPVLNYGHLTPSASSSGLPIGGQVKLIPLREKFPEHYDRFNIVYLVSSALPAHAEEIVCAAKRLGTRLVWNQNGIAYPGCYGDYYAWFNRRMAGLRAQADYILNQSEFSRLSAERYLGPSTAPSEICLNPVDIQTFSPAEAELPREPWQILAAGTSHALYRTKSVLDTFRVLLKRGHNAHLTLAGEFRWKNAVAQVEREMQGIRDRVTILPPFRQSEAPDIYRRAHVLLHTKFNDPCPTVPIEAMACGVPVVGTHSGGMPELVPNVAGVLVPVPQSWTEDQAGDPSALADGVEQIMQKHPAMSQAARDHAIRTFHVNSWIDHHAAVFHNLLAS
ncbi:MAG: glycosyltransferase family 4 protein [Chthoniobacterales bacterium]|nr:glycosyltransferase family 4 protein [Chthoniobacterales bacterium]